MFGLRLLDASGCTNATSTGLAEALPHFPDLVSLDLSRTLGAKDETVFSKLKHLRNLRVLKLAALGLKDSDFSIIASSIGIQVRSLDVSENYLTDTSARLLLEHCIKEATFSSHISHAPLPPVDDSQPLNELDIFGTEDLDQHLRKKLTQGFIGRLAIEAGHDMGITHLHLSRNLMTVEGVSSLLRSGRLQVLDVGSLPVAMQKLQRLSAGGDSDDLVLPGVEKLTPILAKYASEKLVYLRINYNIVAKDAPVDTLNSPRAEVEGDLGIYVQPDATELEAVEPPQPELDSTETALFELPGDTAQLEPADFSSSTEGTMSSQSSNSLNTVEEPSTSMQAPTIRVIPEPIEIKRGPAYAPEPVLDEPLLSPISPRVDATGGLSPLSDSFQNGPTSPSIDRSDEPAARSRPSSTYYIDDLKSRLELRQSRENRLHPGMLPKIHTLVLTDVPTETYDKELALRLIQFIKDCAEETAIARLRAKHTYILPPGRSRVVAEREYTQSLFALKRIVLEVAPLEQAPKKISSSWRQYPTKSTTEDADSETFWEAATQDFSFFGDEECGLPHAEPGRHLPLAAMSGLIVAPQTSAPVTELLQANSTPHQVYDVVSEIAKFRKERKSAYLAAAQAEAEPILEGYWPGDITVVRKTRESSTGSLDYYGNRYESGWHYR